MPSGKPPCIVWFRLDLRVDDNPALKAASESGQPLLPLYIFDAEENKPWPIGAASKWWLHHALAGLADELGEHGLPLILRKGDSGKELRRIIRETGAETVFWNRRYEPAIIKRDKELKASLSEEGLQVESFNASLLFEPFEIRNQSGKPFQVFTPFWKHCLAKDKPKPCRVDLSKAEKLENPPSSANLDELDLLPKKSWDRQFYDRWQPGEQNARQVLGHFLRHRVAEYKSQRNKPAERGTSRLSPYLHFGQISPRQIYDRVQSSSNANGVGGRTFLSEVGWREFAYHLLYHFPQTPNEPLRPEFKDFPWKKQKKLHKAWEKGQTGYPIVDAGMRELWATGWMHNRVRMIAGSLMVKHLLQPWQDGARWFWDTLVDADLASNTLGWQWTAGCGADAAPYFRVFNPILQGQKFDSQGRYTRRWVPELAKLPDEYLFRPWEAPKEVLEEAGIELGKDYPEPIVSHFAGRNRALEAYDRIKK